MTMTMKIAKNRTAAPLQPNAQSYYLLEKVSISSSICLDAALIIFRGNNQEGRFEALIVSS